jgi:hypothetical protein
MKFKAVIRYKDKDGNIKEESVPLRARSRRDAKNQLQYIREIAEKKYGKAIRDKR